MPIKLEQLVEMARKHRMTDAERDAQLRSFAYGNTHFENSNIAREDVDRAVDSLIAEKATLSK